MSDKLVLSQANFAPLVIVCSFLGGMVFGGLLCFRQTRRTGILGLAATCAVVALIVAGTETAEGGRTIGHVLRVAAVIGFLFPIIGTALASAIIGIARLLWAITRRVRKAIWNFSDNVRKDVLSLVTRRSGQERRPRTLSKASRFSLIFLVLTGSVVVALNIGAISDLATRVTPRLPIVTNVLDLISFILVTPKLFTIEPRDDVNDQRIQRGGRSRFRRRTRNPRSRKINKIYIPRATQTYILGVTLFYVAFLLMYNYLIDYEISQFLAFNETVNKIFPSPFSDYIRKHMIEIEEISTKMWSAIAVPFSVVCVVSATSVTLLRAIAKTSPEAQEKLSDKALFWGLVAFVYSRALSMIG